MEIYRGVLLAVAFVALMALVHWFIRPSGGED